jgi:hypothetical protein
VVTAGAVPSERKKDHNKPTTLISSSFPAIFLAGNSATLSMSVRENASLWNAPATHVLARAWAKQSP